MPALGTAAVKAINRFMSVMHRLEERLEARPRVEDFLKEVLTETGYLDALEAERTIEAQGRIENLEALMVAAREYDAATEAPSVEEFLQQLALFSQADDLTDDEGLVTLMTLHNAKGLEFPIVFMIGAEDGVFPHQRSIEEGDVEEERRLCYVGMTRAMRALYVTYARRRNTFGGGGMPGLRSRFLDEIPRELTDEPERSRMAVGAGWAPEPRPRGHELGDGGGVLGRGDGAGGRVPDRRRRHPRGVRRGRRDRNGRGRRRDRALRGRRQRAASDGRLRADQAPLNSKFRRIGAFGVSCA